MKKITTFFLVAILSLTICSSAEAANLGSINNWYADNSSTTWVYYIPYSKLTNGTTCNWTYTYYQGYADAHRQYCSTASYVAASVWGTGTLGFSLTKVSSTQSCPIEVYCTNSAGFEYRFPEYADSYFEDSSHDDAIAHTMLEESDETSVHYVSYNGNGGYRVKALNKAIIIPFTDFVNNPEKIANKTLTLQQYYNKVIAHEFGHALGWYGHSSDPTCLMYAYNSTPVTAPDSKSFTHLSQIYDLTLELNE